MVALEQTIRRRVNLLREEIAEISRLNEEYSHIIHTQAAQQTHRERRDRLEGILIELKSLSTRTINVASGGVSL